MDRSSPLDKGRQSKSTAKRQKIGCKEKGIKMRVKRDPKPEPPS